MTRFPFGIYFRAEQAQIVVVAPDANEVSRTIQAAMRSVEREFEFLLSNLLKPQT